MSVQETFVIVKPDGLAKGLAGQILCEIKKYDLSVIDSARIHLSKNIIREIYLGEEKEVYFDDVVNWVSSAPVLLIKIVGDDAIKKIKWEVVGRYPNGLRGKYSDNWIKNIAHAPDSVESASREMKIANQIFERKNKMNKDKFKDKMVFALTGMSECGKSTVGKYFDSKGISRLKFVKLFGRIRDRISPDEDLKEFVKKEEDKDPFNLWDIFIKELLLEMDRRGVKIVSIESLYGGGLGPYLKRELGEHFCIIYIEASEDLRLQYQMKREGLDSVESAKKILLPRDEIKSASGIPELKGIAGEIIYNSGSIEDLYMAVDKIIGKYQ